MTNLEICNDPVENFQRYLRIKTVHPEPDYGNCLVFLKNYSEDIGLPFFELEVSPGKVVSWIKWEGSDKSLPSLLLNSHTDVVPAIEQHWKFDPFAAHKTDDGDIYGRGTQDMKSVGIQYLEAIRRLRKSDFHPLRTIYLSFVPDEEIGGSEGMAKFIETDTFKSLHVGFALDEGLANPRDAFTVFYGERSAWWIRVTAEGNPGHGSRFIQNTAAEKLRKVLNFFLDYRSEQEKKLCSSSTCMTLGDVTTVNLTRLEGGVAHNVVPSELSAYFDVRIAPTVDVVQFEKMIGEWCSEAGSDVTYAFFQKSINKNLTSISSDDPWFSAFSSAIKSFDIVLEPEIFPAGTDSRYLREIGLPALGFSPMSNTPILLHDHNEFINEDVFVRGIDVYTKVIAALSCVASH